MKKFNFVLRISPKLNKILVKDAKERMLFKKYSYQYSFDWLLSRYAHLEKKKMIDLEELEKCLTL